MSSAIQFNFYWAGCWNSSAREKSRRHVMSFKAHSCVITMALDHFLTFCWPIESSAGPTLSHAQCTSILLLLLSNPCSSRSHTEWMEPPEECGHKSRNVVLLSAKPPNQWTCAHTHRSTPQVRACLNAGGKKPYYYGLYFNLGICAQDCEQRFVHLHFFKFEIPHE